MKISKILSLILLMCLALTLTFALTSCSDEDAATEVISVNVKKDKQTVELKATLDAVYAENHSSETLYVISLPSHDPETAKEQAEVLGEVKVKGSIKFEFPLMDENGFSRLQRAFAIAEKTSTGYVAITNAMYVQNPEIMADKASSSVTPSDIKGLSLSDLYEAKLTGAAHTVIEVNIQEMMLDGYQLGAVKYNRYGVSYFFSGLAVERLDKAVKTANELGIKVYIKTENRSILESIFGTRAVVDVTDKEQALRTDAFYAFLADRYSGEYGQVSDYIIGEAANEMVATFGESETEEYEAAYFAWLRTAHIALKSVDANARVYVPTTNVWRNGRGDVIAAKSFLSHLAENTKTSGDYNWSLALDLGRGEDLPALLSTDSYDYSNIGIDNLSEITDFLNTAAMRFGSERRDFIIDSLTLPTTISENNRATYYICAYYKACEVGADALIYSADASLATLLDKNSNKGAMYYMFLLCGSDVTGQLAEYTEKVEGYGVDELNKHVFKKLTYRQNALYELPEVDANRVTPFPAMLDSFAENSITLAHMSATADGNGIYGRELTVVANTGNGIGAVTAVNVPAKALKEAKYLGITVSSKNRPTLILSITNNASGSKVTYIAEAALVNAETEYYFDISELAERIGESDDLTVTIHLSSKDEVSEITVSDISLYGASGLGWTTVLIIIIVVVCALALVGAIVLLALRRKKKQAAA
ncbi:MAG: hypothetical protein IJC64_01985 [Clostridia bacterium]|nr:hypothetical protein [Clostridia bacterium]